MYESQSNVLHVARKDEEDAQAAKEGMALPSPQIRHKGVNCLSYLVILPPLIRWPCFVIQGRGPWVAGLA